jgi:PAS domain S-box-containing protein
LYDSNGEVYALVSVTSDISEEKKVKSDLLAGQQEIELLFNNTLYGAFFMMLDEPIEWGPHVDKEAVLDYVFEHQRVTRINQAMLDQYRATEDQFIGTLPKDFFAHNIEEGREIWRKFFDLGRWRVETDERRMDGTRVIFEGDYFLLHNDDGKIIGHFGVQQDVTARKENEERLRISEKKLKKLTENVPGVIFEFVRTVEGEFYFDFLSEGIEESLLGVPSDELYENIQSAFDLIHADDLEMVYSQLAEAKPNEQLTFEFRIKSETGDYLWLRSISNTELLPNGEMRWYGIFEDITEEKRQKEELQKLALVAQNTSDHISICNEDGTIFWINTEKESLIGYTRDELLGSSFLDLVKKHSRDTNKCINIGEAFYYKNSFEEHMHMVQKDEQFCHIEYRGTAIFDKNKQFKYFLIVSRDVTEIYEKQNELIRAISLTKEQNARLKEFTYIISHNVRSHSANFTSLTGLLAKESDPKEQNAIVHLLVTVSENLEQTIQHLNSIVSVNEESMNSYDYLTLKPLIESALTNMNQEIIQTDTEINIEIEKDLKIYGVPAYLESILHNLFSNAIKYRHPDRRPVVTINARSTGNGVEMVVADNGLGMDLETYGDKLFGMYRTFHNNKNARGIGLYLTKNQIDAMGAEIFVNSEVDKGTIFQLFFPDDYAN